MKLSCIDDNRLSALRPAVSVALMAGIALSAGPAVVQAQQSTPANSLVSPWSAFGGGNASLSMSSFDRFSSTQMDVLFGRDSAGPYQLSWKNAHTGTEAVSRSGTTLVANTDYTIDLSAGTITFTVPLHASEMVRVSYRCDTLSAIPNPSAQSVPLQWDIWQSGQNRLRFSTLYRLNDTAFGSAQNPNTPASTTYTAVQFTGATRFLPGSSATTGLFLDLQNGDWLRRGGWQFGEQTRLGGNLIGFTYARAGTLFAQSDASGIAAGRELLQATATLSPLHALSLDLFARQTTMLVSTSTTPNQPGSDVTGNVVKEAGSTLSVTLPKGAKVTAGRTVSDTTPPQGDASQSVHDNLAIASPIVKGTQATVSFDALTNQVKSATAADTSPSTYTQTTTVGIKSMPNKLVTVTGTFQNSLDPVNPQDSDKLVVEATPAPKLPKLKLVTSLEDRYQKDGVMRNRSALIDLPPLAWGQLHLSGGMQQSSGPGKDLNVGLMNATARPLRYIELSAGARLRDSNLASALADSNAVNTYTGSLALTPCKPLKITGDFALNPDIADGSVQKVNRQSLGLQADLGIISFRGKYGVENDYVNFRLSNTADVGLDLRLTRWDTLTTAFKLQSLLDSTLSGQTTYQLGFTHKMGSMFNLSLSGLVTTYDQYGHLDPDKTEVKAQAQLGIHF